MTDQVEETPEPKLCDECGREEGTFACKIRHVHMNTGAANMKRAYDEEKRKERQVKKYGV